jgi:hypothetical protein
MEAITRLVADSLARHGFDRPVDPRRLQWSRWFRCESPHSLLVVPSKPGIFALAEEVLDLDGVSKRMLAVLQFSEDDDMAFTLDRMFTQINPMRARLASGSCFLRFVVIEDQDQRRSICAALNQWMLASAEKATGMTADFQSSLEFGAAQVGAGDSPVQATTDRVGRTLPSASSGPALSDSANNIPSPAPVTQPIQKPDSLHAAPHLDSGAATNLHCPHPLPSGF